MFRILFVSFVLVFLGSLTIPFDGAQASKGWDAKNSVTPTQPYNLYTPVPSKNPSTFGIQQDQLQQQHHRR